LLLSGCFAPASGVWCCGEHKVEKKGDLHIIFACNGAMLLYRDFFSSLVFLAKPLGIKAGMEGCRAWLPSYKIWGHLATPAKSRAGIKA